MPIYLFVNYSLPLHEDRLHDVSFTRLLAFIGISMILLKAFFIFFSSWIRCGVYVHVSAYTIHRK